MLFTRNVFWAIDQAGFGRGALHCLGHGCVLSDKVEKDVRGTPRGELPAGIAPREVHGVRFGLRQSLDTVGAYAGIPAIPAGRLSGRIGCHVLPVSGFVVPSIAGLALSTATNLWGIMVGVVFWFFVGVILLLIYHSLPGNKPEYSGELCRKNESYQSEKGMPGAVTS